MLNKQLIEQLKAGDIILHYNESNLELLRAVLTETFPEDKWETSGGDKYYYKAYPEKKENGWSCDKCIPGRYTGCKVIPLSDFLLPETKPKFKVGDKVVTSKFEPNGVIMMVPGMKKFVGKEGEITDIGQYGCPYVHDYFWPESALELVTKPKFKPGDKVTHSRHPEILTIKGYKYGIPQIVDNAGFQWTASDETLTLVTEPSFEIGKEYEFGYGDLWDKGTLLAIHKGRYIADCSDDDYNPYAGVYLRIRPIQPKIIEIEKWAMYNPKNDTFFGKPVSTQNKCEIVYKHAPLDYKATKLTGKITI